MNDTNTEEKVIHLNTMTQLARFLFDFYTALRNEGFTVHEALVLTVEFMRENNPNDSEEE